MECTIDNCTYDKVKLLHELCSLSWFIKKHAITEASKKQDKDMEQLLNNLMHDIDKYGNQLKRLLCSKEI